MGPAEPFRLLLCCPRSSRADLPSRSTVDADSSTHGTSAALYALFQQAGPFVRRQCRRSSDDVVSPALSGPDPSDLCCTLLSVESLVSAAGRLLPSLGGMVARSTRGSIRQTSATRQYFRYATL
jgi:hypothetical protein